MAPAWCSHGVVTVLATTIAVSGTMIFLLLLRTTTTTTNTSSNKSRDLSHAESPPQTPWAKAFLFVLQEERSKDQKESTIC